MGEYTPKEWVKDNPITNIKLKRLKELIDSIAAGSVVDTELSTTSKHAVQNKVITGAIETLESEKQGVNKYYTLEEHPAMSNTYVLESGTIKDICDDFNANKNTFLVVDVTKLRVSTAIADAANNSYICIASAMSYDGDTGAKEVYIFLGMKDANIDNYFYMLKQNLTPDTVADTHSDNLVTNRAITTYVNNSIFGAMGANY